MHMLEHVEMIANDDDEELKVQVIYCRWSDRLTAVMKSKDEIQSGKYCSKVRPTRDDSDEEPVYFGGMNLQNGAIIALFFPVEWSCFSYILDFKIGLQTYESSFCKHGTIG